MAGAEKLLKQLENVRTVAEFDKTIDAIYAAGYELVRKRDKVEFPVKVQWIDPDGNKIGFPHEQIFLVTKSGKPYSQGLQSKTAEIADDVEEPYIQGGFKCKLRQVSKNFDLKKDPALGESQEISKLVDRILEGEEINRVLR